jgi:hypothetical protein
MNLEQDLCDALHGAFGAAQPSAELHSRVMAATRGESAGSRRGPHRLLLAASGLTAALLLAAIVWTAAKPTMTSEAPSAGSPAPLTHYAVGWLTFDYPSSWKARADVIPWVLGLWTGSAPAYCITATPQPTGPDSRCGRQGPLLPGTLYVTVGDYQTQAADPLIDPTQPLALPSGGRYVTVGGEPAILVTSSTAGEETLDWTVVQPKKPHTRLQVHAELADPGAEAMRAEVEAMVASVSFSNPVSVLDPSQAKAVAEQWVYSMHDFPGLGCFSTTPGEVTTGVTTEVPSDFEGSTFHLTTLSKPLPVTCRMEIEPAASVDLWKLTLTQSWTADVDRVAGSHSLVFWLDPDVADPNTDDMVVAGSPDNLGDPIPYSS